jgi:ABC-type branched-subunit amino acid transport system substrate-binding protein
LDGETGKVSFDESGDRINAEYHVMNVYPGGALEAVGQYLFSKVES